MNHKTTSITRRAVLRGLGATIALPYLEIMGGKTWAAAKGQRDPARLACFYIPGAINHYNWFPEDTGFDYTIAPSHKPLEHHRDRFTVLQAIVAIGYVTANDLFRPLFVEPHSQVSFQPNQAPGSCQDFA